MRTYVLRPGDAMPLYEQLYRAIKEDILSGAIAGGEKLPSKRALAEHLSVSRITVETAYSQLQAEGYVSARPRSGFYAERLETAVVMPRALPKPEEEPLLPPPASAGQFPYSVWAKLMRGVLLEDHDRLLTSPPGTGLGELRRAIAGLLLRSRGMVVDPENIVIGAGAEYLYNILIQLLGRDRCYGIENPGHQKQRRVYEANGLKLCAIELDACGVDPGALARTPVSVMHLSPNHQFPTGIVTPIARRQQLMGWVSEGDRWIIEDDYDSEFRFSGRMIPTMFHMDPTGRVVYCNTFSKTLTPALRISYLILPPELMARYRSKLGFYSCTVPSFEQLTLARFLDEGYFEKHVSRMRRRYRLLRDRFLELLGQSPMADRLMVQGQEAGLHILVKLQTSRSDDEIRQALTDGGVRAAVLSQYTADPARTEPGWVVMPYSDLEQTELPGIVALLERLVQDG